MRLAVSVLGTEVLVIETGPAQPDDGPGDCTTIPVGFVAAFDRPDEASHLPDRSTLY